MAEGLSRRRAICLAASRRAWMQATYVAASSLTEYWLTSTICSTRRPTTRRSHPRTCGQGRPVMARGEQRGNREAKKPKKEKPKEAIPTSPFAHQGKASTPAKPSGGKR